MEMTDSAMHIDTWTCRVCEAQRSFGWERLPDPDALRRRADRLEQLAVEVENSELATRLEGSM